jgi:hypothetical protein
MKTDTRRAGQMFRDQDSTTCGDEEEQEEEDGRGHAARRRHLRTQTTF